MFESDELWKPVNHSEIKSIYQVSNFGKIKNISNPDLIYDPEYHSTNGYDFALFETTNDTIKLFPIDEIIGFSFIKPIGAEMLPRGLTIIHKDGNNRNNCLNNLQFIPFIEKWTYISCPIQLKSGNVVNPISDRYIISNTGIIYDKHSNHVISIYVDDGYYKTTLLYDDGVYRTSKLHRILLLSFNIPGRTDSRTFINHINGDRSDFSLKNLEWCSPQENVKHAILTRLQVNPSGEEHPRAKFTDIQRKCIYEIIKTLKDVQPSHITGLIRRRLPRISRDDVKYAKKIISNTEHFEFPDLSKYWKNPQKFTDEEYSELVEIVNKIFDKYGIHQLQEYYTEYELLRENNSQNRK